MTGLILKVIFIVKMYLCICRAVADTTVERVIREGASSVEEVAARCGAGSSCGGCREAVARMISGREPVSTGPCADCPRRRNAVCSHAPAG